jgi:hypothetical protein
MAFPRFLRFVIDLRFLLFGLALRAHIVLAVDIRVVRATHEMSICRMLVTGSAMRTHRIEENRTYPQPTLLSPWARYRSTFMSDNPTITIL